MDERDEQREIRQEVDRLPVRRLLVLAVVGLAVATGAILWAAAWSLGPPVRQALPEGTRVPVEQAAGGPVLQTLIVPDEPRYGARSTDARLQEYGWVDREGGVVRIPVREAMRLLAEGHSP